MPLKDKTRNSFKDNTYWGRDGLGELYSGRVYLDSDGVERRIETRKDLFGKDYTRITDA